MKFSEAWLREWVNPARLHRGLADQLSMAGLEVDAVEPVAPAFSGVVVGEVLSVEAHPDAKKLRVCTVNVAGSAPLQIICGAANVAQGMRVPTAVVGARLPGDFKIKKAKLRGRRILRHDLFRQRTGSGGELATASCRCPPMHRSARISAITWACTIMPSMWI